MRVRFLAATLCILLVPSHALSEPDVECLTQLEGCTLCTTPQATVEILSCGGSTSPAEGLPEELLAPPDRSVMTGLHALVAEVLWENWEGEDFSLRPLFDRPGRIYLGRAMAEIAALYPESRPTLAELHQAALYRVLGDLMDEARSVRLMERPNGDGTSVVQVESPRARVAWILRLLRENGAFVGVDFSGIVVEESEAIAVQPDSTFELFLSVLRRLESRAPRQPKSTL